MLHTPFAIEIAVLLYLQHSADMALASQHTLLKPMTNVWPKLNDLDLRAYLGMEQRQPLRARLVLVLLPLLACSLAAVFCPGHQHLSQVCP